MERVKIGFRIKTYLPKLQENMHISFSMISAMSNEFNVVLYSQTHKCMPRILHQSQGVRLILSNGMDLIFNGHLVHGGGRPRINDKGLMLKDKRLFYYLWNKSKKCLTENGGDIYRKHIPMCSYYQKKDYPCCECEHGIQSVFDFTNIDVDNLSVGDTIVGNLEYLGWVVVKGADITMKLNETLKQITQKGKWFRIGKDHGASIKFDSDCLSKSYRDWMVNEEIIEYCHDVQSKVISKCLKDDQYEIGYRNILCNNFFNDEDQIPHTDYRVSMK